MNNNQQQLLAMSHPSFRGGYQAGRLYTFEKQVPLTDMQLVEDLQSLFQEKEASKEIEAIYHTIGHLVGQMSAWVIPRQPSEDNTQAIRDAFLTKFRQGSGARGSALVESIQQFWVLQDRLAQTLDADNFDQMLRNGVEEVL